jgi:hypothetical protein
MAKVERRDAFFAAGFRSCHLFPTALTDRPPKGVAPKNTSFFGAIFSVQYHVKLSSFTKTGSGHTPRR